jgi:NAD+ diphosphatase
MSHDHSKTDRWLIFQHDKLVLHRETHLSLSDSTLLTLKPYFVREHALGIWNGETIFCADIGIDFALSDDLTAIPLRAAFETIGDSWYHAAAKAFSILNWDRNHQFCGRCGQATTRNNNLYERGCANCHLHFYPRISPSMIVLIQKGEEILMARSHHFNPGVYGLVAGFVEAGESLEDAVHREVYEETRITVKNLQYFGSQAWPFPDSLMLGFFAEYADGEIIIEPKEIEAAGWFHYTKLPGRPSRISIASRMVETFLAQQTKNQLR